LSAIGVPNKDPEQSPDLGEEMQEYDLEILCEEIKDVVVEEKP